MIGCFRVKDCGILCFERIMLLPPALLCLESLLALGVDDTILLVVTTHV